MSVSFSVLSWALAEPYVRGCVSNVFNASNALLLNLIYSNDDSNLLQVSTVLNSDMLSASVECNARPKDRPLLRSLAMAIATYHPRHKAPDRGLMRPSHLLGLWRYRR